jgi:hypothetical protein
MKTYRKRWKIICGQKPMPKMLFVRGTTWSPVAMTGSVTGFRKQEVQNRWNSWETSSRPSFDVIDW